MTKTASRHIEALMTDGLAEARDEAAACHFTPSATIRCVGRPLFRTQLARDLALLVELDLAVECWTCLPLTLSFADADGVVQEHVPDLSLWRNGTLEYLDASVRDGWNVIDGVRHHFVPGAEIYDGPRVSNAREMMRYACRHVPLSDRVRLLAWLAEASTLTLVEAATAMRESREPIGAVVALALHRFIHLDWEEEPIGPDTIVRLGS